MMMIIGIIILESYLPKDEKSIQIANIIPVLEERFSVSKKTLTEHAKIKDGLLKLKI